MFNPSPIRMMVVDGQAIIHRGLHAMLDGYKELKIVADATDGEEAVRLCTHYCFDVILMEIALPRINGIAATRIIRTRYPQTQVLFFTNSMDNILVKDAFTAGAIGYLLKSASSSELVNAIHQTYQGRTTMAHEVTQCLLHATINRPMVGSDLTNREREVLALLVAGMNNRTIAQTLTVSPSTVKFHVSNILLKLHIKARTEAIGVALRHNLVA